MSAETLEWLRNNVRVGYTGSDGPAWWAANDHMADGTHFDGPVPADEARKILSVPLVEAKLYATYTNAAGGSEVANGDGRKAIVRQDTGDLIGIFKDGYEVHGYEEWTLKMISNLLDTGAGELGIKSVGLLRNGGQAWLQVRMAETFEVAGYGYTPFITAATSADGSISSTYITGVDAAVCDNTLSAAILNAQTKIKVKHTRKSGERYGEIRDALGLVYSVRDGFQTAADELMGTPVSDSEFERWLDLTVPVPEAKDGKRGTRGQTMANTKRAALTDLWTSDAKVSPWRNTAFGVVQADNTYRTWSGIVRGADGGRFERNLTNMVDGTTEAKDAAALTALSTVLNRQLLAA